MMRTVMPARQTRTEPLSRSWIRLDEWQAILVHAAVQALSMCMPGQDRKQHETVIPLFSGRWRRGYRWHAC